MINSNVLVLNLDYEPISVIKVKRAIILTLLGKAELVETYDGKRIRSVSMSLPLPSIVRLHRYIHLKNRDIPLTRRNILRRDGYTCQYCGSKEGPMTVDHIIPKKYGGRDTWENLVCACTECNAKKGDHKPDEVGMKLLKKPRKPHFFTFVYSSVGIPDKKWKPYLFMSS